MEKRKISHPLIDSPNAYNSWGSARQSQEPGLRPGLPRAGRVQARELSSAASQDVGAEAELEAEETGLSPALR